MTIRKESFEKILRTFFKKQSRLYEKEAQLQYDLALYLNKKLYLIKGFKVYLEYTSYRYGKKKCETDIILLNEETGEFIPIELKYKTKSVGITNRFDLSNQAAQNSGRYAYIKDIKRIEDLRKGSSKSKNINGPLKEFLFGFAIFLTNDKSYWEKTKQNAKGSIKHRNLRIGNGDVLSGKLTSKKNRSNIKSVTLSNSYECSWNDYHIEKEYGCQENDDFKYLIIGVD